MWFYLTWGQMSLKKLTQGNMSTKITTCDKCNSRNIKELNPENRETVKAPLCKIDCECNDCSAKFTISSWTKFGKRKGIRY